MANNQVVTAYDDAGFPATAAKTFAVSAAGTFVVKGGPGRVHKVSVTTAGTGAVTIYDNAQGQASGTILWSGVAAGVYDVNLPAQNGITVVAAASPSSATIGYA